MTDNKRKIVRDYAPPSDEEISKYMDFSAVSKELSNSTAATSSGGSATLLTKGVIALSIAGVAFVYSINFYLKNEVSAPELSVDVSNAGIQFSRTSNAAAQIKYPEELTYIEFPVETEPEEHSEEPSPVKKKKIPQQNKVEKSDNQVLITNRFTDAEPVIGFDSLYAYLRSALIYPLAPPADTIEGVVEISFVVNKTGEIAKPSIITPLGELFDAEAIRVIKSMPKWNPAKVNETPLSTKKQIAIQFKKQN